MIAHRVARRLLAMDQARTVVQELRGLIPILDQPNKAYFQNVVEQLQSAPPDINGAIEQLQQKSSQLRPDAFLRQYIARFVALLQGKEAPADPELDRLKEVFKVDTTKVQRPKPLPPPRG